jgi:putative ABC transport system ATP-binding protein
MSSQPTPPAEPRDPHSAGSGSDRRPDSGSDRRPDSGSDRRPENGFDRRPDGGVTAPTASAQPNRTVEPVLSLQELTRVHGTGASEVHALRGIDLEVHAGELVAVMGPSGSGKSTLLTIAGGLDLPTSGRVVVEGTDLTTAGRKDIAALRRRSIGYVFQDYNLIPALTAAENVALPRELDGVSSRRARREAVAALEEIGLRELADRFPDEMSGGQQQRVAIARALVGDRRLVLADEPTGALDSETGDAVLALLRSRCDAGAAGVLVTHEPRFAAWADRVVFLRDGSVVDMTLRSSAESLLAGGAAQ